MRLPLRTLPTTFVLLVLIFVGLCLVPSDALAQSKYAALPKLEDVFESTIRIVAIIGGFLAFIAFIYGGFKYIVARGDPKALASAQSTIVWSLLGFVLIIVSWIILIFISEFTGVDVTVFDLIVGNP